MLKLTTATLGMTMALTGSLSLAWAEAMQISEPASQDGAVATTVNISSTTNLTQDAPGSDAALMGDGVPAARPTMDMGSSMTTPAAMDTGPATDGTSSMATPEGLPAEIPTGSAGSMAVDTGGTDGDNEAPPSAIPAAVPLGK